LNYEKLFEDSYTRVLGEGIGLSNRGKTFFKQFYDTFFSKSGEISEKFANVDMSTQIGVLQKSMVHIISFYVTKTDTEYLLSIARTHSRDEYDIKPEYYDVWLESLLETVRILDPEFEDKIELAWQLAMTPGIQFMKFHY
jgi:hemoglobin-like flavoprotein